MNANSRSGNDNWRPLALTIIGVAAVMVVVFRLLPYSMRYINLAPAGALLLFAGARLKPGWWLLAALVPMIGTDIYFYAAKGWKPSPFVYLAYGIYLCLGVFVLRRSESPWWIGGMALAGSIQFFLVTNFGSWLHQVLVPEQFTDASLRYSPDWAGLMQCYEAGLPFYRGTLAGDLFFSASFFAAHAWLAHAYFPAESVKLSPMSSTSTETIE